jgi:hypothetical protein
MSPCFLYIAEIKSNSEKIPTYAELQIHIHFHGHPTANKTDGKRQLLFVCCKQKTEVANFHLFAANGNEIGCLFFLVGKWSTVIDDCCSSKRAHPCKNVAIT